MNRNNIELYVHIPFCARKCAYCDFLSGPADEVTQERYVRCLCAEISSTGAWLKEQPEETGPAGMEPAGGYQVSSIFFGGGTPSILKPEQIVRIMETVGGSFRLAEDAEISIEANPGTVDLEKLSAYRKAGINRISFGCQSTDNDELRKLGRIHSWEVFLQSYDLACQAGFTNINVDLMSGLPGQTVDSWKKSLETIANLDNGDGSRGPEHLSAYSLILEEGTPFYENRDKLDLPDEDSERIMYECTHEVLEQYGYHQYEISNYARDGYECRHNVGYWTGVPYLGFGLGASSLWEATRYHNTRSMKTYLDMQSETPAAEGTPAGKKTPSGKDFLAYPGIKIVDEVLSKRDREAEFMITGLRMTRGVSKEDFIERFNETVEDVYGKVIREYRDKQLLRDENGRIFLTRRGISLSNLVMADFL